MEEYPQDPLTFPNQDDDDVLSNSRESLVVNDGSFGWGGGAWTGLGLLKR